jgi:PAS domain S-box-containing protein
MVYKTVDHIIGSPRSSLFPPEVDRTQKKALETVFETGIPVRTEGALTLEDRIRWFDHNLTPLKDADNRVRSVLGISRDITERKRAEKQLYESKQLYQRLLEQTFDAIAIHKDKKIAYLNERAVKILGAASAEELIGRSIFDLIHPDSLRDLEDRLRNMSSGHGNPAPVMAEKFFRVDGSIVTVEVMAILFDDNGIPAVRVAFREIPSPIKRGSVSKIKQMV